MGWVVLFHTDFVSEFERLPDAVQDDLLARVGVIEELGPELGRPTVDTLVSSSFPNMKEIRFNCDGVWRFAFAFDAARAAIILCGGNKEAVDQKKFYKKLIALADVRFASHMKETTGDLKKSERPAPASKPE
ncbi:type II toxin-antitoxin system RelE/ParE family toxin [Tardiphaga sp.]|uniref:type II toxin-antitoxin system RelE/ParE family toxin n=1 Tax=Tardiphaga sp. TaxID=1926292 RepID=UPI0025F3C493|nr:type II toxin-antitoxin system RelE/ParE family toxin [Tardiphaga sp.]